MNITQKLALPLLVTTSAFVLWGVTATPSYASGFFGNLPSNDFSGTPVSASSGTLIKAVSFTLPTGNNYSLDSTILRLESYETGDIPILEILNDTGGVNPGSTVLASFTNPTPQGVGIFDYTFNPSSAFTFQAGTKYWLNLKLSAGSIQWRGSFPSVTPTGISTFGDYRFSNNGTTFSSSATLNSFEINATEQIESVPEPTSVMGLFAFVGTFLLVSRKKSDLN